MVFCVYRFAQLTGLDRILRRRATMRKKAFLIAAALLVASSIPAVAQFPKLKIAELDLARCASGEYEGRTFIVTDARYLTSCRSVSTSPQIKFGVQCTCDNGTYRSQFSTNDTASTYEGLEIGSDTGLHLATLRFVDATDYLALGYTATGAKVFANVFTTGYATGGVLELTKDLLAVSFKSSGTTVATFKLAKTSTIVATPLGIPSLATLPACDSTIAPAGTTAIIWDTTGPDLCVCAEGVDWAPLDGTGTCA